MSQIVGKYVFVSNDNNYGEYLKAAGFSLLQRNLAMKSKPTIEISKAGGNYTMKTTELKSTEIVFALGEEFEDVTADGRKAKSVVAMDDDGSLNLVSRIGAESITSKMVFTGVDLTITRRANGVVGTQVFERQ